MSQTKITANILAANAAQDNLNAGASITLTKPITLSSEAVITGNLTTSGSISALSANITGNLVVDTNTFVVDSVNNRVGIGTATPNTRFTVKSGGQDQSVFSVHYSSSDTPIFRVDQNNPNVGLFTIYNASGIPVHRFSSDAGSYFVNNGHNMGIGTTTPSEKLTVSGNISASGTITGSNLVYTSGNQVNIGGNKTFLNNVTVNGQLTAPNQTATTSDAVMTRALGDARYSTHNRRIATNTLGNKSVFEQFIDFEDQYDADIVLSNAFGSANFGASPGVFGDVWVPGNLGGLAVFQGQDAHTHNGVYLVRGQTSSNSCFYMGIRRATSPDNLSNTVREFTCRVFLRSIDFATQGYFKIGPIPKGGTGGGQDSLQGGLMFNPYIHATNLVIAANKTGVVSPFTFTTTPANVDFIDTGLNFVNLFDRWINIKYIVDQSDGVNTRLIITVVREGVTLLSLNYNVSVDLASIARNFSTWAIGASRELGIQYGKFTHTTRGEVYFDYLYSKVSGVSTAPSNWNELRF